MKTHCRRLSVLLVAALLVIGGQAQAAHADQTSQLRTTGGTGYGGQSNIAVRRPGLPAGAIYDAKTGVRRFDGSLLMAGHRSGSDGRVICIRQYISPSGLPDTQPVADCNGISSGNGLLAAFRNPRQGVIDTRYEAPGIVNFSVETDEFDIEFDSILFRGYMTNDDAALTQNNATSLRYQTAPNNSGATALWGDPFLQAVTPRACGRRDGNAFWYYAFNRTC